MRVVQAVGRAVTMAVLGLARLILPAFGVVPPEWLMNGGRKKPPPKTDDQSAQ